MSINAADVQWDKPESINPAHVQWDAPPEDTSLFGKVKKFATPGINALDAESNMMSQLGAGEGLLSTGTGFLAAPVAGVGALVSRPFRSLYAGNEENPISNTFEEISNALTYKPKSKTGQNVAEILGEVASLPMRKASEGWGLILDETGKALPSELPEVPYLRPLVGTLAEVSAMGALGGKKAISDRAAQVKNAVSMDGMKDVLAPTETPTVPPVQSTAWQRRQAAEQMVREQRAKEPIKTDEVQWDEKPYTATEAGDIQQNRTIDEKLNAIADAQEREATGSNEAAFEAAKKAERERQAAENEAFRQETGVESGVYTKEELDRMEAEQAAKQKAKEQQDLLNLVSDADMEAANMPVESGAITKTPKSESLSKQQTSARIAQYDSIIEEAGRTHGVDSDLIRGVIEAESRGKNDARSPKGAMGLMQLMPGTARELGVTNAFDPRQNINGGVRYLKMLLDRYSGDEAKALAAYNWGMKRVDKLGKGELDLSKLPEETRNYVERILKDREKTEPVKTGEAIRGDDVKWDEGTKPVEEVKAKEVKAEEPVITPEPVPEAIKPHTTEISTTEGSKPSGIAKSIEAKAIEAGLIKDGFDKLAGFDPTTMKAQAEHAAKVMADVENARKIIRGEVPLPEGLRGVSLIKAMEEHIKTTKDPQMAYELANSPHVAEVSKAAQELSLTRGREKDSFSAKVAEIKKARQNKSGLTETDTSKIKNMLKEEIKKVNLDNADLIWSKFLSAIKC